MTTSTNTTTATIGGGLLINMGQATTWLNIIPTHLSLSIVWVVHSVSHCGRKLLGVAGRHAQMTGEAAELIRLAGLGEPLNGP